MKINHLQLNTSTLRDPKAVMQYILDNNIDIACLQEIAYPTGQENPLQKLCEEKGLNYFEGIHFYYKDKNLTLGNAVISKFPIVDYQVLYFNTPNYYPKTIGENDFVGSTLIEDDNTVESMASRGLKHSIKSRAIPIVTLKLEEQLVRVYSIQFTVSSWATETEQMYTMAQLLNSQIHFSRKIPTIMSGDFNLQSDSYSIELLKKELNHHTDNLKNTLADNHRALAVDFPEGLAVDHVFSYDLEHIETNAINIDFSDHKAIVSNFELN